MVCSPEPVEPTSLSTPTDATGAVRAAEKEPWSERMLWRPDGSRLHAVDLDDWSLWRSNPSPDGIASGEDQLFGEARRAETKHSA